LAVEVIQALVTRPDAVRLQLFLAIWNRNTTPRLQKSAELKILSAAFVATFCQIGHFSTKASTKFATKMQDQHSRNML